MLPLDNIIKKLMATIILSIFNFWQTKTIVNIVPILWIIPKIQFRVYYHSSRLNFIDII